MAQSKVSDEQIVPDPVAVEELKDDDYVCCDGAYEDDGSDDDETKGSPQHVATRNVDTVDNDERNGDRDKDKNNSHTDDRASDAHECESAEVIF